MRKIDSTEEIQKIILPILVYADTICREFNLRYALSYGTLIGAIRHKGFIPWDDDIDIMMPRPDFNRFVEIMRQKQMSGEDQFAMMDPYDIESFYTVWMLKLYRKDTLFYECPRKYTLSYGAFIDIFPVDAWPDTMDATQQLFKQHHFYDKILHEYAASKFSTSRMRRLVKPICRPIAKWGLKRWQALCNQRDFESSTYAGVLIGTDWYRERLYKEEFDNLIDVEFEGHRFKTIPSYDAYLRSIYGDYMQLPPEDERRRGHIEHLYIK